jgi:hypothetical protein
MDWNYSFAVLSFLVGSLAGFQGIYEVYGPYSPRALRVPPGVLYLFSRGFFPATIFSAFYHYGIFEQLLWLKAMACGTGWELFLRSKLYVKKVRRDEENVEDLFRGPLDLVRWYQGVFLKRIDGCFAKEKIQFVKNTLPQVADFQKLCTRAANRIDAWNDSKLRADVKAVIEKLLIKFEAERKGLAGQALVECEEKYSYTLCYSLMILLSRDDAKTLVSG